MVILYLVAIVVANLSVTWFGAGFVAFNGFLFIGFNLIARDVLHERWHRNNLWLRMFAMLVAGGLISIVVQLDALPVALASCVAFICAGATDTIVYQILYKRGLLIRMNGSNVFSAAVDSLVFLGIVFTGHPAFWSLVLASYAAKVGGGLFWSLVIRFLQSKHMILLSTVRSN